jgi:hypothetical protein
MGFKMVASGRVVDPHNFNADPDLVFNLNANLDPAFHFNADPDPAFHFNADPESGSRSCSSKQCESVSTGLYTLQGSILSLHASLMSVHGPPRRHFELLKLLNLFFNANPDPAFHSNTDPESGCDSGFQQQCGSGIPF